MSRVLLIGVGGLPQLSLEQVDFPRLRLWQFARALLKAGHAVHMVCGLSPTLWSSWQGQQSSASDWVQLEWEGHGLHVCYLPLEALDRADLPAQWVRACQPSVAVSAGPFAPARAAARLPRPLPVWIDLPGDLMAEAQLRARASGQDAHVLHAREVLSAALLRGDAFSVIGVRQQHALWGQLGAFGRLGRSVLEPPPVEVVPVGVEPLWERWAERAVQASVPRVIWPAALNTWSDGDTLFRVGERVLEQHASVELVVTGGPIVGHEERAWSRLQEAIRHSPHARRWRLTGWLPAEQAAEEVRAATVGLSLDVGGLEPVLGSRTRLLYGLALGLPWVLTPGSELAQALVEAGWAQPVAVGAVEQISQAVLGALSVSARDEQARRQLLARFSGAATTQALQDFVASPQSYPVGVEVEGGLQARLWALESALAEVHHSATWRLLGGFWTQLRRLRRGGGGGGGVEQDKGGT